MAQPASTAATFSASRSARATPPLYLSARTVATSTAAAGWRPAWRHLMSKNFSAPRSAPKPASVTTMSPSRSAARVATTELQPWAMLANGPPWTSAGLFSSVCTRFGRIAWASSTAIAPSALRSRAVTGRRSRVWPTTMAPSRRSRSARSVARQRIAITSDAAMMSKPVSRGKPFLGPPSATVTIAERPVVHVDDAPPRHPPGVDVERVAPVDVVVDQRREQVVGGGDRVEVAGEVEVDVLHRHHLGVAAAGRPALLAEARPERGLAQADHRPPADGVERVAEADGGRGLALAGGGRVDRGDEDELALRPRRRRPASPARKSGASLALSWPKGIRLSGGMPRPAAISAMGRVRAARAMSMSVGWGMRLSEAQASGG